LAINLVEASGGPNGRIRGGHQLVDRGLCLAEGAVLALAYSFIHSFIRSTFRQSIKLAWLELVQMGGQWEVDRDREHGVEHRGSVFMTMHQ